MNFEYSQLCEVAEVIDSLHRTPTYSAQGFPMVRCTDVKYGELNINSTLRVDKDVALDFSRRYKPAVNDIIITRVGTYGVTARVVDTQFCLGQNTSAIVPKTINPRYLYGALNSKTVWSQIEAGVVGSTQKTLSLKVINALKIPRLGKMQESEIAIILGSFDDRITLLRETNTTLEAIAQALFKSWFVDFDPVRAKQEGREPEGMDVDTAALFPDCFEESELGLVPKGWRVTTLADAFEINPKRTLTKGAMAPYLDMASLATSGHCVETPIPREMGSGAKFRNGDTLLARITPCLENGKSAFVDFLADDQIGWGSTEFLVLRPKGPLPEYFGYLLCRHSPFREYAIQSMSGTSGRQRIQNDVLGRYLLAIPDNGVATAFTEVVQAIQKRITGNHQAAQTLATLRDTLLPRLISGQLRLPDAEALIEEAAA